MPRRLEHVPIDTIKEADINPKDHNIPGVRASIDRFGYVSPLVMDDRTGRLVAGHGRLASLLARQDSGETPPEGIQVNEHGQWLIPVVRGWASRSDADAKAYLIADNRHTELGGWDHAELHQLLTELGDPELTQIAGFSPADMDELLESITNEADDDTSDDDEDEDETPDGTALEALDSVTTPDPTFAIGQGDIWWLGKNHVLICASPFTDHKLWAPFLVDDAIFMPFPSTMAPFAETAPGRRVVLVQPNTYLAALTITRWEYVTGNKATQDSSHT